METEIQVSLSAPALNWRECIICTESKETTAFPNSTLTATCEHAQTACFQCIQTSIKAEVNNKSWREVACPECSSLLTYESVQRYADVETREKYEDMSIRHVIQSDDDFIWVCICFDFPFELP
jgi:hypothetical protein